MEEWLRGVGDAFCGWEVVLVDDYHAGDWLVLLWIWGFKDLDMRIRTCGLVYRLVLNVEASRHRTLALLFLGKRSEMQILHVCSWLTVYLSAHGNMLLVEEFSTHKEGSIFL